MHKAQHRIRLQFVQLPAVQSEKCSPLCFSALQCTLCISQCPSAVQCSVCQVQCTVFKFSAASYVTVQWGCNLCPVQHTVYQRSTMCNVHCALYSGHCAVGTAQCAMCTVQWVTLQCSGCISVQWVYLSAAS